MGTKAETGNKYNPWPIGKLPEHWRRTEPKAVWEKGYCWTDARDIVEMFEQKVANFVGCKYAVSTDCCSHGLFLCLKYIDAHWHVAGDTIIIPERTYMSVPMQIIHAGFRVQFADIKWSGMYRLGPYAIWDAAGRLRKGMYSEEIKFNKFALMVLSFQIKKRLPIGKGGMILTNNEQAYRWLKLASYDGRDLNAPYDKDEPPLMGWHMYMTPEDAARGIWLMDQLLQTGDDPERWADTMGYKNYTNLSRLEVFHSSNKCLNPSRLWDIMW